MVWNFKDVQDQTGKVIIITGGNSGIGFEAALMLAEKRAKVILACRSEERGTKAVEKIKEKVENADVVFMQLDLANLESVEKFSNQVIEKYDRLDILINNAGIMALQEREKTKDGLEMQFGVNHFGHFALTSQLFPLLKQSSNSRIVVISSAVHYVSLNGIDLEDINSEKGYSKWGRYIGSKLCNLLFTHALDRKIKDAGLDIKVIAAHPGYSKTELQEKDFVVKHLTKLVGQSAKQGALPTVMAATDETLEGGEFIGPKWLGWGNPKRVQPSKKSYDQNQQEELWKISEEMTKTKFTI